MQPLGGLPIIFVQGRRDHRRFYCLAICSVFLLLFIKRYNIIPCIVTNIGTKPTGMITQGKESMVAAALGSVPNVYAKAKSKRPKPFHMIANPLENLTLLMSRYASGIAAIAIKKSPTPALYANIAGSTPSDRP